MSPEELGETLVLAVLQGVAEFLPISSSGHLVIVGELLRRATGRTIDPASAMQLNVVLHVGTLASILWVYRRELTTMLRDARLCTAIVVATLPLVVGGLAIKDVVDRVFDSPLAAGCGLLVTATFLLLGQRLQRDAKSIDELTPATALVVGLFQLVAILPGVSRSGSTISGGLLVGLRREAAAKFSFLIAIPAICGAAVLELRHLFDGQGTSNSVAALALGAVVSFVVGALALSWLLRIVTERRLHWFAAYCAVVGLATIAWQLTELAGAAN